MRTAVVGAGPVGLFCAMALARRGDEVTVIDRDPGPTAEGEWRRRGVMQYSHPHFFRHIVRQALVGTLPDVWDQLVAAGGVPACADGFPAEFTGLQCRRSTFERTLWQAAAREPGLSVRTGRADGLEVTDGRVTGVLVDGARVEADRVLCATGRGSSLGNDLRAPGIEQSCGFSYVTRMYRARPGSPPLPGGFPMGAVYDGYIAIAFPQDDRTLSALIVRPTEDAGLARLRDTEAFDTAVAAVPVLAPWTTTYTPFTDVMVGGRLTNGYRGQLDELGRVAAPGVYFVGDAVCTTNPSAGRGVSLGLRQAEALLGMLGEPDARDGAEQFDAWCLDHIRPWHDDHVETDAELLRRYAGEDIDPEGPLSSDVICAASEQDPSLLPVVGPFLGMLTLPASLQAVEEQARALLRTGWRPTYSEGPTRDQLVAMTGQPVPV